MLGTAQASGWTHMRCDAWAEGIPISRKSVPLDLTFMLLQITTIPFILQSQSNFANKFLDMQTNKCF